MPILKQHNVGLEIELFSSAKVLDNPDNYIEDYREAFKDILSSRNISVHGPFTDFVPASRDVEIRRITQNRFENAYQRAREFGSCRIIYHTGFIPKTYSPEEWLENSIAFWTDFMKDKSDDIQVHIENVYEDDLILMTQLLDAVNSPVFSACLDIGHVNANSSKSLEYWIKGLNKRIKHIHLHNNNGSYDNHNGLLNGTIDMENTLRLLKETVPHASCALEVFDAEEIVSSLEFLNNL